MKSHDAMWRRWNTWKQLETLAAATMKSHDNHATRGFPTTRDHREIPAMMRALSVRNLMGTPIPNLSPRRKRIVFADTIFALSSAPGRAGVAAVRVSGPGSREILALVPSRARHKCYQSSRGTPGHFRLSGALRDSRPSHHFVV